jgi:hypothetical protein
MYALTRAPDVAEPYGPTDWLAHGVPGDTAAPDEASPKSATQSADATGPGPTVAPVGPLPPEESSRLMGYFSNQCIV